MAKQTRETGISSRKTVTVYGMKADGHKQSMGTDTHTHTWGQLLTTGPHC